MTLLSVFLVVWLTGAEPQTLQSPSSNRVESVQVRGTTRARSSTAILGQILTKQGDELNPATIARDIRAVYALGYYDDVRVEEEEGTKGGKVIIFYVHEKPLIKSIKYVGN